MVNQGLSDSVNSRLQITVMNALSTNQLHWNKPYLLKGDSAPKRRPRWLQDHQQQLVYELKIW